MDLNQFRPVCGYLRVVPHVVGLGWSPGNAPRLLRMQIRDCGQRDGQEYPQLLSESGSQPAPKAEEIIIHNLPLSTLGCFWSPLTRRPIVSLPTDSRVDLGHGVGRRPPGVPRKNGQIVVSESRNKSYSLHLLICLD